MSGQLRVQVESSYLDHESRPSIRRAACFISPPLPPSPPPLTRPAGLAQLSRERSPPIMERQSRRSRVPLALRIDLGALEVAAVVHIDRLPLREKLKRPQPRLAMAVAGAPRATEGQLDLRAHGAGVDVDDAPGDLVHG